MEIKDLPEKYRKQAQAEYDGQMKRRAKYGNHKTVSQGITFDSQKEAFRFQELLMMERAGVISDLRLQQNFTLVEGYMTPDGKKVKPMIYRADFVYMQDGERVIEDVKSEATKENPVYKIKRKLMMEHGYIVTEFI